jgi:uncharacterized protein (UPF0333 family)
MPRGQISMEYMLVVGFSLMLIVPVIAIYGIERQGMNSQVAIRQAYNIATKITDASESVYYLGKPAKTTLKVYMPADVENITIGGREIVFFVRAYRGSSEVVGTSDVDMTGTVSPHQGIQYIEIAAGETGVNITTV